MKARFFVSILILMAVVSHGSFLSQFPYTVCHRFQRILSDVEKEGVELTVEERELVKTVRLSCEAPRRSPTRLPFPPRPTPFVNVGNCPCQCKDPDAAEKECKPIPKSRCWIQTTKCQHGQATCCC